MRLGIVHQNKMMEKRSKRFLHNKNSCSSSNSIYQDESLAEGVRIQQDFFNSFLYTDQLTNNKISLNLYQNQKKEYGKNCKQSDNLDNCFNLMKETRKFQMSNLQKKYYKFHHSQSPSICEGSLDTSKNANHNDSMNEKEKVLRYKIRKRKQKQEYEQHKSDLSNYLNYSRKKYNLQKSLKAKPTQKIFETQQEKKAKKKNKNLKKFSIPSLQKSVDTDPSQTEYIEKLNKEIKFQIMRDGEYLIKPKISELLRARILKQDKCFERVTVGVNEDLIEHQEKASSSNKNVGRKSEKIDPLKQTSQNLMKELKTYEFNLPESSNREKENNPFKFLLKNNDDKVIPKKNSKSQEQFLLLDATVKGNYFRVEIELSMNENLLCVVDQEENNLLHICILNNHEKLFHMIFLKCRDAKVNLFKRKNRYRKSPQDLGNIFNFFRSPELIKDIEKFRREENLKLFSCLITNKTLGFLGNETN